VLSLLLLCWAATAGAQPYDPAYRWRTIETEHFRITFHQGEERLAGLVADAAERAHAALSPVLGYAPPRRTEVVISDDSDDANGSATPLPYDTIRLFAVPPPELSELNVYRDWVSNLVFHEYVHILHLDHVEGIPNVANHVFGKLFAPNGLAPSWMTEGLAVLHEGDGDPGPESGRNHSAIFDMYVRSLALERPGFPRLDQVSNPPLWWPLGSTPYALGGRFMEFLEERNGADAIRGYIARQGAQIWPYAPSWVGQPFFGAGFPELWAEFAAREEMHAREVLTRIHERPVTVPARITFQGGQAGWPRWSADGASIAYLRAGLDEDPALLQVTPAGKRTGPSVRVLAGAGLATGAGRAVLASGEIWHEYRLFDDLWQVDLATGSRRRLTDGARAAEPALSADGAWLAYVRRTGPGDTALVRRRLDGGREEAVLSGPGEQVFAPALSPDGGRIAFAIQSLGRRDVALLDGERLVWVTQDVAVDASPTFTPDGAWLLFSSDRGGVYNLYAWPVTPCLAGEEGCALRQVTNVETGAFQPAVSPDGKTIAFITYSRDGFDVATLPFDPSTWLDPEHEPATGAEPERAEAPELASRPYRAWRTLGPTFWFPWIGGDAAGTTLGALTGGGDVLGRHSYALSAWWGTQSREPGYTAAYLGGWSWPRVDLLSSRFVGSARGGRRLQTIWTPVDAGLDFTFTRLDWSSVVRVGWDGTFRKVLGGAPGTARHSEQLGRLGGFGSEVTLRASWSDAHRFVRSISPEQGRTVTFAGAVASRALGSDYELNRASGAIAQYLRIPFTRHGALALRLAGGAADGSIGTSAPFSLGGAFQPDVPPSCSGRRS
jgi:Tol biopolymer transport system component